MRTISTLFGSIVFLAEKNWIKKSTVIQVYE